MVRFSPGRDFDDEEDDSGPSCRPIKKFKSSASNASSLPMPSPEEASSVVQFAGCSVIGEETEREPLEERFQYEDEGEPVESDREVEDDGDDELEDQSDGENSYIPFILTDPDALDCPICFEPLTAPVFQCDNGHVACGACCTKVCNRCPTCSWSIGHNRCRAVEKIFESIKICCRNERYGCKEMVKYSDKSNHEDSCIFAPCSCPIVECNYVNSSWHLYEHFGAKHPNSSKIFSFNCPFSVYLDRDQKFSILRDDVEGKIFMVNNHLGESLATAVSAVCIGPPTSSKKRHFCEISVKCGESSTIMLESAVESIPAWIDGPPAKNFLLVPNHCKNARQQLKLKVCIQDVDE